MNHILEVINANDDGDFVETNGIFYRADTDKVICVGESGAKDWDAQVMISPFPAANFSFLPIAGEAPLSVAFTDTTTGNPLKWSWTFGDGGTSTDQHPAHTFAKDGTYSVSLTVTNYGGSDDKTDSVVVDSGCACDDVFTGDNGDAPSTTKWTYTGSPTINNNRLRYSNNFSFQTMTNNCLFLDDFDCQVDLYPVSYPSSSDYTLASLELIQTRLIRNFFNIEIRIVSGAANVRTLDREYDVIANTSLALVPDFIQFRIARVGTIETAYYRLSETDSWITHGSEDSASPLFTVNEIFTQLNLAVDNYGSDYITDFDNFIVNSGCPT